MTFTSEMVEVVVELLTEFGLAASIRSSGVPTYDPATLSVNSNPATRTALIAFFDPANSNMSGYEENTNDDAKSHKWFYLRSDTPVAVGDTVVVGASEFLVENQTTIAPNGEVIYQRVRSSQSK